MKRWHIIETLPQREAWTADNLAEGRFDAARIAAGGPRADLGDLRIGAVVGQAPARKAFEVWDPKVEEVDTRRHQRRNGKHRRRTIMRRMFPGYLFVRFDALSDPQWWRVLTAPGVRGVLTVGGMPAALPTVVVDRIRLIQGDLTKDGPIKPIAQGDPVEILDVGGAWLGHIGKLAQLDARGRVEVLLMILGSERRVVTTVDKIRPA